MTELSRLSNRPRAWRSTAETYTHKDTNMETARDAVPAHRDKKCEKCEETRPQDVCKRAFVLNHAR